MKIIITLLVLLISVQIFPTNSLSKKLNNINGFIENKGQMVDMNGKLVPDVLFKYEAPGLDLYITKTGLTYLFKVKGEKEKHNNNNNNKIQLKKRKLLWERVDLSFKNVNIKESNIIKQFESSEGQINYYLSHCPNGIKNIRKYNKITIKYIYPNIDWVLYNTSDHGFKYDFILHKGANTKQIKLVYNSKSKIKLNQKGDIIINTKYGQLIEKAPISYYDKNKIFSKYELLKYSPDKFGGFTTIFDFKFLKLIPDIIGKKELVIDPELIWSTLFGGNNADGPWSIENDSKNNAVIVGYTTSTNFPVQNNGGYYQSDLIVGTPIWSDCFISKFDSDGNKIWTTYYGGSHHDIAFDIAIDNNDNIFIIGETISTDFPLLDNGGYYQTTSSGNRTGIGIKFSSNGNRIWCSYIGGSDIDICTSVDYNEKLNNFSVVGWTTSTDFPLVTNNNSYNSANIGYNGAGFITVFDSNCMMNWSTLIGGNAKTQALDVDADNQGNIFVTGITQDSNFPIVNSGTYNQSILSGQDFFITKFNLNKQISWSTFYGGSSTEKEPSLKVDNNGNVFLLGMSYSSNFPTQNSGGFFQSFVFWSHTVMVKFDNSGNRIHATHLKSGAYSMANPVQYIGNTVAVDKCNNHFYIFIQANDTTMPIVNESLQSFSQPAYCDQAPNNDQKLQNYLAEFDEDFNLVNGTYFGGKDRSWRGCINVDRSGYVWVSGEWIITNQLNSYPLVEGNGYFDNVYKGGDDGFIARFKSDFQKDYVENIDTTFFCDSIIINNIWYNNTHTIQSYIRDINGCDSIVNKNYLISDCKKMNSIIIPNTFTPNNDNENDVFKITLNGEIIKEGGDLVIFNRWGNKVYQSTDKMQWDGGKNNSGVYYYIFKFNKKEYKGNITLFK